MQNVAARYRSDECTLGLGAGAFDAISAAFSLVRLVAHPDRNAFLNRREVIPAFKDADRVNEWFGVDLRRRPSEVCA